MSGGGIVVANAPVSYGAFELTVGIDPTAPTGLDVLDQVAAAGYLGIDLGPVGLLGNGAELRERLGSRNLGLAGAYVELRYADSDALPQSMATLDEVLDALDAGGRNPDLPAPRPTLADAGSASRRANPGRAVADHGLGHDAEGWQRFGVGLGEIVRRCRDRGYEPTFHFEIGTYVEAPWEIERVLDVSDVGLCLDTGHLLLGGGDPVAAIGAWAERINHVHMKDARRDVMAGIVRDAAPSTAIWEREAFPPLGAGDLDADAVLEGLRGIGYRGWMVVEQDTLPRTKERFDRAASDQRANRAFLRKRGL